MKKIIAISLLVTGIAIIFIIVLIQWEQKVLRFEAMKIDKYPNVTSWDISDTLGFPDGSPRAEIYFRTEDSSGDVTSFYKENLTQKGWTFLKEDTFVSGRPTYYFSKEGRRLWLVYIDKWSLKPPNNYHITIFNK